MKHIILSGTLACAGALSMLADFSYQQTTTLTGGAMARIAGVFSKQAREPNVAKVLVKGHRMANISARAAQIIDVNKETITHIDFDKKTWSVTTFAQMKQMMEDMMNRINSRRGNQPDVQFKAAVKETGQTKTVAGLPAKELILTLTMEGADQKTGNTGSMDITNDMWLAPVAGYEEVRNFQKLMADKLGMMPGQNPMFGQRPEMMKGMADLYKEMAKLDGVPVQTIMRMGGAGTGTNTGGNNPSANQQEQPSGRDGAAAAALGRLGLGGFGRRKKNDQDSSGEQPPANNGQQSASGVLMEMTTEASGFSSEAVDESKFEVPSGFKQVDPQMGRRGGR